MLVPNLHLDHKSHCSTSFVKIKLAKYNKYGCEVILAFGKTISNHFILHRESMGPFDMFSFSIGNFAFLTKYPQDALLKFILCQFCPFNVQY